MFRYASLVLIAGCGLSEQRFEVDGIPELCDAAAKCAGTYDQAACVDQLRSADREGCAYDREAANDCLDGLADAKCVPHAPFDLKELAIPDACYRAWGCDWIDLSPLTQ